MQEHLTVARIVHPSTQDIFFPHYGLLQGEDTNTNMINQAAIHRLIFQKIKKNNKGCKRRQQLQSYPHTFGQQRNCCQNNVVALDTGVDPYLLFMLCLIQTAVEWASERLCVVINLTNACEWHRLCCGTQLLQYTCLPVTCSWGIICKQVLFI